MARRLLSLFSLVAALSLTLIGMPLSSTQAAPIRVDGIDGEHALQQTPNASGKGDSSTPAMYIVRLQGEPIATYAGGIDGLQATSPSVTGERKLQIHNSPSQSYRAYLAHQRNAVVSQISNTIGRAAEVVYTYDVVFNGIGLQLTGAEAAKIADLPGVVSVQKAVTQYPTTDVGPSWIHADQVWNGTATNLYVATILGANEVPPVGTTAMGSGTFMLAGSTLSYDIHVTGLTPTAAHIHRGAAGVSGPVVVSLTPGTAAGSYVGSTTLSVSDLTLLQTDGLYVNFHTAANPGGEIRGQVTGSKGEGVLVGIIDTGINFGHPSFAATGGDGYTHINPFGAGHYVGVCDPADPIYQPTKVCNAKLVGGRTYPETHDVDPDSPEDDDGHGSHTGSTTAGNVITSTLLNGVQMGRISGVAPHANVIIYDTCNTGAGCPGAALLAAINDAVADGVDVINYSIGGGSRDPWEDPSALAFLDARAAGVFVSASAGNSGPGAQTIGSPSNSPWVTSVGASTHNRVLVSSVTNLNSSGGTLPNIVGKALSGGYSSHPLVYAGAAPYNNALCGPFPAGTFTGQIVVCDRGTYGRVEKGQNVLNAGGGGMILANNAASGNSLVADAHALPAVHITYNDGVTLKAWMSTGTGHVATISGTTKDLTPTNGDVMASFSSRGPDLTSPDVLKPDVAAPGVDVFAAGVNDPASPEPEFELLSGTSMAAPHDAGAAALVHQVHPNWTPAQIQSALMTTSVQQGVRKEDAVTPATPWDRGAGRIDVGRAVRAGLILNETKTRYLAADPAIGGDPTKLNTASFANTNCVGMCSWTRVLSSTLGASSTWTATFTSTSGITLSVAPAGPITIPAHGTATITVTANVMGLPMNVGLFGGVMLTEGTSQAPSAFFPVAVVGVDHILPTPLVISIRTKTGTQATGSFINSAPITALTTTKFGLVKGTQNTTVLPGDPTNGSIYDDLTVAGGVYTKTVTVPAGSKRLVAEIFSSTAQDSDIHVHLDGSGGGALDGIPQAAEAVCSSTSSGPLEYCDLANPAAGTYIILVQNYQPSSAAGDTIMISTGVVSSSSAGNMTVAGSASIAGGTPFTLNVGWNIPTLQEGDRWYGGFDVGTDAGHAGNIGFLPVDVVRLQNYRAFIPILRK